MDSTFISIHDLTEDARILYASDSIVDMLGHTPDEVVNRPAWDFFHPDELPLAKMMHSRGVKLDKAAVLAYCHIKNRAGNWVCCECCFSVVYDVMVCCTSIYRYGATSEKRALEAPVVRKLFTSSPKDPRYHMLTHLSSKFTSAPNDQDHEPRAALFLNRFTRTLTIMYATSGVEQILGISGEAMKGRSFYYCIQENCLEDAVRCLESAKGNDSIAYLRFWFRDPRTDDQNRGQGADSQSEEDGDSSDEVMTELSDSDGEGGVHVSDASGSGSGNTTSGTGSGAEASSNTASGSSGAVTRNVTDGEASDGSPPGSGSTPGSTSDGNNADERGIELEAVVSCTSDGLVVCLRRAHPLLPPAAQPAPPTATYPSAAYPTHAPRGIFAAPWAPEPVFEPQLPAHPQPQWRVAYGQEEAQASAPAVNGPSRTAFMDTIRDVAVFAWALTGINGSLSAYARGKPERESVPQDGFPIWEPSPPGPGGSGGSGSGSGSGSGGWGGSGMLGAMGGKDPFGDPGLSSRSSGSASASGAQA